jgi:hypothetical protein
MKLIMYNVDHKTDTQVVREVHCHLLMTDKIEDAALFLEESKNIKAYRYKIIELAKKMTNIEFQSTSDICIYCEGSNINGKGYFCGIECEELETQEAKEYDRKVS